MYVGVMPATNRPFVISANVMEEGGCVAGTMTIPWGVT